MEEQKRVEVIQRVFRGEVTMAEAAMVLGVSDRKLPIKTHRRFVELARGKYRGFND